MPKVGGKSFPYTKKGIAAAKVAAKTAEKPGSSKVEKAKKAIIANRQMRGYETLFATPFQKYKMPKAAKATVGGLKKTQVEGTIAGIGGVAAAAALAQGLAAFDRMKALKK